MNNTMTLKKILWFILFVIVGLVAFNLLYPTKSHAEDNTVSKSRFYNNHKKILDSISGKITRVEKSHFDTFGIHHLPNANTYEFEITRVVEAHQPWLKYDTQAIVKITCSQIGLEVSTTLTRIGYDVLDKRIKPGRAYYILTLGDGIAVVTSYKPSVSATHIDCGIDTEMFLEYAENKVDNNE